MRGLIIANVAFSLLVVITAVTYVNVKSNPKESPPTIQKNNLLAMYLEDESGDYALSSDNKFPTDGYVLNLEKSFCKNGGVLSQDPTTKAIALSTSSKDECTVYFDKEIFPAQTTLAQLKITSNGTKTKFSSVAQTDEGVFEMEDDYGTSYYYRGDVTNNYVKFAGFYWRIIRVNGDGSLRIVYDGDQAYANGASDSARFIGASAYNTNYADAKYVGYMYGPAGTTVSTSKEEAQTNTENSTIKTYIDNWYKTNIVDKEYASAVADAIFCNDRSTPGSAATGNNDDTGLGYGRYNTTFFGAYARFQGDYSNPQPTFKCPQKNDAFTVSDTVRGNGSLTYPVGLITMDEMLAAGSGSYNARNDYYYLYRPSNSCWWSLSPSYTMSIYGGAIYAVCGGNDNNVLSQGVGSVMKVAPVLNLNSEYISTLIGDGTMDNPYRAPNVTP